MMIAAVLAVAASPGAEAHDAGGRKHVHPPKASGQSRSFVGAATYGSDAATGSGASATTQETPGATTGTVRSRPLPYESADRAPAPFERSTEQNAQRPASPFETSRQRNRDRAAYTRSHRSTWSSSRQYERRGERLDRNNFGEDHDVIMPDADSDF